MVPVTRRGVQPQGVGGDKIAVVPAGGLREGHRDASNGRRRADEPTADCRAAPVAKSMAWRPTSPSGCESFRRSSHSRRFESAPVGDASLGWSRLRRDALNNRALHGFQRAVDLSRALAAPHGECLLARTARLADVRHLRYELESRGRVEQRERDSEAQVRETHRPVELGVVVVYPAHAVALPDHPNREHID